MADFKTEKLSFIFDKLFDIDKSGTIERNDFEETAKRVIQLRNLNETTKQAEVLDGFIKIWEDLKLIADHDGDNKITKPEWLQLWSDKSKCFSWSKSYMEFMFSLQDKSGDGSIDESEFLAVTTGLAVDPDESKASFSTITKNGIESLNLEYYTKLWEEFFFSDDKSALGNFIFGKKF